MALFNKISIAKAYAAIALIFGAFFLASTPPFGTGDETAHFERSYEIATGAFLGADGVPAGMQSLIDDAFGKVKSGEAVSAEDYQRWAAIPLDGADITPWPEPIRVVMRLHSPLCYLHLAPVSAVGAAFGLPPLWQFYLGRLAALLVGVILVSAAIARAPSALRPALASVALLPTTIVYFAGLNIESLLVGLGFYFFALIASLCAEPDKRLARGDIIALAAVAFLLGQFKTGYLLIPAAALVLPKTKFASLPSRALILALIILPGVVASLGWAMIVKDAILGDLVYSTLDGNHVEPAAQLKGVLADPLGYAAVVARTIFASDAPTIAWKTFIGTAGWTNIPLPPLFLALSTVALVLVWMSGEAAPKPLTRPFAAFVQLSVFAATALFILTLVYFQWNGVGAQTITGFQGRYLLAAAPFVLALAPLRLELLAAPGRREALAFGAAIIGLLAMAAAVTDRYYGHGSAIQREASSASASRIREISESFAQSADQSSSAAIGAQIASTSSISMVEGAPAK